MISNTQRIPVFLSLCFIGILTVSCAKKEQFIVSSDEEGVICSAKSSFNDTIFYENKFPDTTLYYYSALSKKQNLELKQAVLNLKTEKSIPSFVLMPGGGTFIVATDKVRFYQGNYSIQSPNMKKIFKLFSQIAPNMQECRKVEDFWDIEGVAAPENPVE